MTSKMVSGIGPSVQSGMMGATKDTRVSEEKDISFQNLLSNPKPSADQASVKDAGALKTETKNSAAAQDNSFDGMEKRQAVKIEDATKPKELTADEKTAVEKAVGEFEEKVTEVLAEELDVTEDEIAAAMETLGLTFLDLASPDQLVQLVGELTGTEEPVDLLTNQNLKVIMAQVSELATNLTEEAGIPIEELTALGMTETDRNEMIMATAEVLPEDAAFSKVMNAVSEEGALETAVEVPVEGDIPSTEKASETKAAETERPTDVPDENEGRPVESEVIRTGDIETETKDTSENSANNAESNLSSETEHAFTEKRDVTEKEETKGTDFQEVHHAANTYQQVENHQTAAPEATTQPEAARPLVDPRDLMEQFTEFARTSITENTSEIEMRLNPENLGRLLIHVTEQEGTVRASIQTQNVEVKEALESQLAVLRTTLEGQGMKVTEVEVTVASHEFEENLEKGNANTENPEQGEDRERGSEQTGGSRRRNLNMNDLGSLQGLMTEEEELAAKIMRDNGNSVDYTA